MSAPSPARLASWALALACTLALVVAFIQTGARPSWAATTPYGCTFTVPKPAIVKGKAVFTVKASCATSREKRRLDAELVADDPSYDDTLRGGSTSIPVGRGSYAVVGTRWSCREDPSGADEVYLRVRIETHHNGAWRKSAWKNGSAASGDCH